MTDKIKELLREDGTLPRVIAKGFDAFKPIAYSGTDGENWYCNVCAADADDIEIIDFMVVLDHRNSVNCSICGERIGRRQ